MPHLNPPKTPSHSPLRPRPESGYTLIEILAASAILGLIIIGLTSMLNRGIDEEANSEMQRWAAIQLGAFMELTENHPIYKDFSSDVFIPSTTICTPPSENVACTISTSFIDTTINYSVSVPVPAKRIRFEVTLGSVSLVDYAYYPLTQALP